MIICSRNRARLLTAALASVMQQDYPPSHFEVVVVDNGSTDDTARVVSTLSGQAAPMRYIYRKEPGLGGARNDGARASRYEILAYIDDDALASPTWLSAITSTFDSVGGEVVALGGLTSVVWEEAPPKWLTPRFMPYFSGTDKLGDSSRLLSDDEYPVGTNLAVRRQALETVGGFDETLTRYNDEIDVCRRLRRSGGRIWFEPEARVVHRIVGDRLTRRSMLMRGFWQGYSDVVIGLPRPGLVSSSDLQSACVLASQSAFDVLLASVALLQRRPDESMWHLFLASGRMGRLRAHLSYSAHNRIQ